MKSEIGPHSIVKLAKQHLCLAALIAHCHFFCIFSMVGVRGVLCIILREFPGENLRGSNMPQILGNFGLGILSFKRLGIAPWNQKF